MDRQDEVRELSMMILDKLTEISEKFVRKNKVKHHILSALQIASLDFLGSVIIANSKMMSDKSKQLDYVELVKTNTNLMFEQIKIMIKSIELH